MDEAGRSVVQPEPLAHAELTRRIIGACHVVANELGHGFVESVYRRALTVELERMDLRAREEMAFQVHYRGRSVGTFVADIVVEGLIVVELKAVKGLGQDHSAQVINYLKATCLPVGLLVNFGTPRIEVRRFDNRFLAEQRR